jgi:hypothetical protein
MWRNAQDMSLIEVWMPRCGVYAEVVAGAEFQAIGKGTLAKKKAAW